MMKECANANGNGGGNNWPRICDTCRSAGCTVYCRADSAYLCAGCDARIHAATLVASRHERVWVCEACERAPAAFLCKADAASLCSSCDADIHSANPLASRHHRVPILPISGYPFGPPASQLAAPGGGDEEGFVAPEVEVEEEEEAANEEDDEAEAASWLLLNNDEQSNGFLFGGEVEEYLDLVECNSREDNQFTIHYDDQHQQQHNYSVPQSQKGYAGDSVVPVQRGGEARAQMQHHFQSGLDFDSSQAGFSYNGSLSQSVSISSLNVGVVPESTISDVSISHLKPPKGTSDIFSGPPIQMPSHLAQIDREARVLRYREKKKTRKFEKKIRYASRKAYAETRPRIKGRFAKRTDLEAEVDQMFSTTLMTDAGYGIVPSFCISS